MSKINKEKQTLVPVELLKELLRYEYETGLFYWLVSRGNTKVGKVAGNVNSRGYVVIEINGYAYRAHRLAWIYVHGDYPDGEQPLIDHVNGNPSDNRIANLRVSSHGENQRNRKKHVNNTSGVAGIGRVKKKRPSGKIDDYWRAYWHDENGKECTKSFPVSKYGEDGAKQLAIDYRDEQIRLLEIDYNITYSDRHGT